MTSERTFSPPAIAARPSRIIGASLVVLLTGALAIAARGKAMAQQGVPAHAEHAATSTCKEAVLGLHRVSYANPMRLDKRSRLKIQIRHQSCHLSPDIRRNQVPMSRKQA